ncbi:glycoside hydrolase [Trametopsis cervina]|nr:glycoside hydrolase [Trametopsis cervina]
MQLTSGNFTALLHALSLTQGFIKPAPLLGSLPVDSKALAGILSPINLATNNANAASGVSRPLPRDILQDEGQDPCAYPPYPSTPLALQPFPPFDQAKANVYRYRQQQSVNLGSWFVHEDWMTPSLFACAADKQLSEVDIAHGWGSTDAARAVLEKHWDTFITDADFAYLASIGINTVRLPIGYWTLGPDFCVNTPFEDVADVYQNSWARVVRTINVADSHGIGVLVDLHGAPGSQNGQQHSGISDGATNLFDHPDYINQTMNALTFLAAELTFVTNVVGIQLLNEPQSVPSLESFYTQAISAMRTIYPNATNFPLYLHDGFDLERFSSFVSQRSDFVVQDHHSYFVYTPQDSSEPASQHTSDVEGDISGALQMASNRQRRNLVIDEFSCALTYDSLKGEDDQDEARRQFCTGQMEVYANATAGWAFWAYRKEECDDDPGWCFTSAVGRALPSSFFSYGVPPAPPQELPSMAVLAEGMTPPSTGSTFPDASSSSNSDTSSLAAPPGYRRAFNPRARHAKMLFTKRDDLAQERSLAKGYNDGFLTAKIFAVYDLSKLGFTGQYILDSIATLGPTVIVPGTETAYENGFMQGLADGEAAVARGLGAAKVS